MIVGQIHTHPNAGSEFEQGPSDEDFNSLACIGGQAHPGEITGTVISTNKTYTYSFGPGGQHIIY